MGRPRSSVPVQTPRGWQVAVPAALGSSRRVQRTFATKAQALSWQRAAYAALDQGTSLPDRGEPSPARVQGRTPKPGTGFSDVAASYVAERYVKLQRGKQTRQDAVEATLKNHLLPFMARHGFRDGREVTREAYVDLLRDLAYGTGPAGAPEVPDANLTIAEAVALTGASRSTIKRRIEDGSLPGSYIDDRGRRVISTGDLANAGLLSGALRRGPRKPSEGHAPAYVADIRRTFDAILAHGVATAGWTLQFDPNTVPNPRNTNHSPRRAQVTLEQCREIAGRLHPVHQVGLWVMRILSLRISEAYGLRVSDLLDDGHAALIRVERQGGRKFRHRTADGKAYSSDRSASLKTSTSVRVLAVPPALLDLLRVVIVVFHTDDKGHVQSDARLIPALSREDAGGQHAFRKALRDAAAGAGVDVGDGRDTESVLLPAPKDLRAGAITDMAWNDVPELHRKRFAGHVAGHDVHSRAYILDSRDLAPLIATADVVNRSVLSACPDGLLVPTARSCTTGNQPLLQVDRERIDEALVSLGWLVPAAGTAGDLLISVGDAAALLGRSPQTVRRWAAGGMIKGSVLQESDGYLLPAADVAALAERLRTRRTLPRAAADLGLSYQRAWAFVRKEGLPASPDPFDGALLVPRETEEALVAWTLDRQDRPQTIPGGVSAAGAAAIASAARLRRW